MKNSLSSINDIASRKYHIKGFTLIELLIYTGISVIIGGLTVGILLTVTRVNQNASATAEVSGQMNFVLQRLQQLVSESSNIEIEVATTTSALKLRMQDSAKDPTCISLVNGVIKIAEGPGSPNANDCNSTTSDLTSPKVVVNTLNFKKMVQYPGHDTLSLDMTMAYNTTNPGSQVSRSLSSAIGRVSAATFDSDVIPGGTYEFSLGQTGAPWFKTITADGTAANPSYTFANNTGTGLFRAGANILGFTTAGLERMRIDASGNVGIGTTTPTTGKLVVSGGKLDMSTNEIINVAGPTASSSVATKGYVDAAAAGRGPVIAMSAESAATYTHANAAKYCYDLSAAAAVAMDGNTTTIYTDWRLPTVGEAAVFEGTITSTNYIWTATMYEATNNNWLKLRLSDGKWGYNAESSTVNHVRCVR